MRSLARAIFGLLCGQFLLGMVGNFYAQLPKDVPAGMFVTAWTGPRIVPSRMSAVSEARNE